MTAYFIEPPGTAEQPVTVSVSRRIVKGREADYEDWVHGIAEAAAEFVGHQGVNILRPSAQTGGRYVMIYRFDREDHAAAWENSAERAHWIAKLDGIAEAGVERRRVTGLEVWFDLPEVPVNAHAPRHKMAMILVIVVFSLVYPMQIFLGPLMSDLPHWSRTLVIVVIQVLLMTYLVMPRVTALLRRWLFGAA